MKLLIDVARAAGILALIGVSLSPREWFADKSGELRGPEYRNEQFLAVVSALLLAAWLFKAQRPIQPLLALGIVLVELGIVGTSVSVEGLHRKWMARVNMAAGLSIIGVAGLASRGPFLIKSPGAHLRQSAWAVGIVVAVAYLGLRFVARRVPGRTRALIS